MSSELSRRQVLVLSSLALASFTPLSKLLAAEDDRVDAGALALYDHDGIYPEFLPRGFFLVRREKKLFAQSAICTHKRCKLRPADDGFACKCHGSRFSIDGKVQKGPAKADLPRFAIKLDANKHVVVDLSIEMRGASLSDAGAFLDIAPV